MTVMGARHRACAPKEFLAREVTRFDSKRETRLSKVFASEELVPRGASSREWRWSLRSTFVGLGTSSGSTTPIGRSKSQLQQHSASTIANPYISAILVGHSETLWRWLTL